MPDYKNVKLSCTFSTKVKHGQFTTEINAILEPHYFGDQQNALKYIIQQDSLSNISNLFTSDYSSKLYNFNRKPCDKVTKIYKAYGWMH